MNNFSLSDTLSGFSSTQSTSQFSQTLTFQASPTENTSTLILRQDPQGNVFALFSYTVSKDQKPHVQLRRIGAGMMTLPPTLVGDATLHSMSSKVDLNWSGHSLTMKANALGDGYKIEVPLLGKFKWKESGLSSYTFVDDGGVEIAKYKSRWSGIKGSALKLCRPCEDQFLDLLVLSLLAINEAGETELEVVSEFVSAVAGV